LSRLRPGRGANCDRCGGLRGNRCRTCIVCLPGFMGLEPGSRYRAEGAALPWRNVVIAVGRGAITSIENVLDIELSAPGLVELQIKRRIDANKARQFDEVVRGRVGIREVDDAESGAPHRI